MDITSVKDIVLDAIQITELIMEERKYALPCSLSCHLSCGGNGVYLYRMVFRLAGLEIDTKLHKPEDVKITRQIFYRSPATGPWNSVRLYDMFVVTEGGKIITSKKVTKGGTPDKPKERKKIKFLYKSISYNEEKGEGN